jgi:hypothetical protein
MGAGVGHSGPHEGVLMRRSVLLAAPMLLTAHLAWAQAVVICPTCTQEIPAALNYVAVLARWAQQFQQMEAQYQQLVETYESLHHLNAQSLTTAAGLLGNAQHLAGSAAAELPGLNYGANLSGAGQQFYNQNHYYTPEGEDWNALEMKRRQYATANLQGEAQTSIEAIEKRLAGLNELQASIPEQPDVTAVAAINARINSEQAFLANETNHIQQLQLLQQTQTHVDQQRAEQHSRELSDKWDAAVAPQAWGN